MSTLSPLLPLTPRLQLIDNAKKFLATEQGQKMEQQFRECLRRVWAGGWDCLATRCLR
jgi:hypothetical protein